MSRIFVIIDYLNSLEFYLFYVNRIKMKIVTYQCIIFPNYMCVLRPGNAR
jgi:hypothetical protein